MKKITLKFLIIMVLPFIFSSSDMNAQSLMKEVSLEKQIANSSLLIEGEVVSKKSFWDQGNKNIYTVNTIQVYKVFKGEVLTTIDVITHGGVVGLSAEIVTPSLSLHKNEVGVFMLNTNNNIEFTTLSKKNQFKPYSGAQGFYRYNIDRNTVTNPFNKKTGISTVFYNEIMTYTKSNYTEVTNYNVSKKQLASKQSSTSLVPSGITFSPTTVSAGTQTVLTINGAGFGAVKGKVGFSRADDGGATFTDALDTQVLTWTDTQITVQVPSGAGTGTIQVRDSADDAATSGASLTVSFSEINVVSNQAPSGPNGGLDVAYSTKHINEDGAGGYTWQMFTGFDANSAARSSFLRAFETWRCETGINWTIGATTAVNTIVADGVNVIRFDVGAELGDGLLGRCTSRYGGCFINGNTGIDWYISEMDIVFNDSPDNSGSAGTVETWNFGTGASTSSEYDFESVALHELGHGHQLGHVIDSNNDVMHYSLFNGQDERNLATNNISAGNSVQSRSTASGTCSFLAMTNYTGACGLGIEDNELENGVTIYPNPAKKQFFVNNASTVDIERIFIFDVSGRLISEIDMTNASRIKTISLENASKGLYFVDIHANGSSITKKLIVQ